MEKLYELSIILKDKGSLSVLSREEEQCASTGTSSSLQSRPPESL